MRSHKTNSTTNQAEPAARKRGDSVNQVNLIGRLVAAPRLRETASGKYVTTVQIATNGKSHAEFQDVVLRGQLADFATMYLGKGRLVSVGGRLQSRQWQAADGSTRRTVEIVANRLQALSSRSAPEAPAAWPSELVHGRVLTRPCQGGQGRSATYSWGSVLRGLHGAAWRKGAASRRFAPVLAEDFVLLP